MFTSPFEFFAAHPEATECFIVLGYVFASLDEAKAYAAGTNQKPERVEPEVAADPQGTEPPAAPEEGADNTAAGNEGE